jgi:hypothetical protein
VSDAGTARLPCTAVLLIDSAVDATSQGKVVLL